jgi:hypothetical protein
VFDNRVLKRIFGPKREEVAGVWRRLHNEEFRNMYVSPDSTRVIKSRWMRWVEHVTCMGKRRHAYKILVGTTEGERVIGRPEQRCENNIRMDLKNMVGGFGRDLSGAREGPVASCCEHGNECSDAIKGGEFLD